MIPIKTFPCISTVRGLDFGGIRDLWYDGVYQSGCADDLHEHGGIIRRDVALGGYERKTICPSEQWNHDPPAFRGARGQATDLEISAKRILKLREHINEIIAEKTGQSVEKVAFDTDRDYFMSAYEAKEYGIIDEIIEEEMIDGGTVLMAVLFLFSSWTNWNVPGTEWWFCTWYNHSLISMYRR